MFKDLLLQLMTWKLGLISELRQNVKWHMIKKNNDLIFDAWDGGFFSITTLAKMFIRIMILDYGFIIRFIKKKMIKEKS